MKNLFKGICLVAALMATFAMVGCGGGGGNSYITAPVGNPSLNVRIPTSALGGAAGAGTNLRASVRASATFDDLLRLTVQYLNDNGTLQDAENEARKLTKNGKNYECNDISLLPGRDYRFKVFLQNAPNTILLENQISRDEVVKDAEIKVDETSTLKTRTFDAWIEKNPTNKSFANFVKNTKKTIDQLADKDVVEKLSGQKAGDIKTQVSDLVTKVEANIDAAIDKAKKEGKKEEDIVPTELVFAVPELEKTDIKKEDIADIGTEDLTKPEPTPQPTPTPTTGYVDELNQKLAENTTWKTSDERTIYKHLTTGRDFPGQIYDDEIDDWVDVDPIADGGKAAEIIYSTKDGANWTAPTDKPIIIYDEMGGSHPYCIFRNNKRGEISWAQQFHYKKATNLFRYVYYNHEKFREEPVEKGLEPYELLDDRSFKVEEVTLDNVTYYRATNNDNAKDIYLFKLIKRPEEIFKVNPSDEVIQLENLINATWEPATEEKIQELIGYKHDRSARVIYSHNGTKWETPTNVFLTYAEIPYAFHPWHVYVNGKHAEGASIETNNDVWYISNLVVSENKTIAGSYKFLTTKIEGADYLQMKNTGSDDIMTSMFMKVVGLPGDIGDDITEMINNSSTSGNR